MTRVLLLTALAAAIVLPGSPAAALTLVVDAAGSGDYLTIQAGLDAAASGDTVLVHPGTYTGEFNRALDFQGKALLLTSSAGATETIIDCQGADRAFFFHSGEDSASVVHDLAVVNGSEICGGAVYCEDSGARFVDVAFFANESAKFGGAIYASGARTIVLDGCTFVNNSITGSGGAVYVGSMTDAIIRGCTFASNDAGVYGGALVCDANSTATIRNCLIGGNSAGQGGGIYCGVGSAVDLVEVSLEHNTATNSGAGGVYCDQGCRATLDRCSLIANAASGSQAGGVRFFQSGPSSLTNCTLAFNTAGYRGGALECSDTDSVTITGCTLVGNSGNSGAGGVYLYQSSPEITNTIIAFSAAGEGVLCDTGSESPTITHCFVYANSGGDSLCGNYHDNAFVDPLLCDVLGGDYTLCADSPCLPGTTWPERVGAHDQGCSACGSAAEPASWGRIKSLFR